MPEGVVEIVEFNDTYRQPRTHTNSKYQFKQFMSSKISKLKETKSTRKQDKDEDEEDERNDRELQELLETTKLIQNYTNAELTGKEKRKHVQEKIVELGGKLKLPKASLPMHLGMKKKAQERVEKKLKMERDLGVLTSTRKTEILKSEKILAKEHLSKKKVKIDKGLMGKKTKDGVMTRKNGVMTVSKQLIERIEKGNSNSGKSHKRTKIKF